MRVLIAVIGALSTMAALVSAAEPGRVQFSNSPLLGDGELQKTSHALAKVFQFRIDHGKLEIDRRAWDEYAKAFEKDNPEDDGFGQMQQALANDPEAAAALKMNLAMTQMIRAGMGPAPPLLSLFEGIRKAAGANPGGRGSGGLGARATWDSSFSGPSLTGRVDTSMDCEEFAIRETGAPQRTLEFLTFDQSGFRIEISNQLGDMISVRQEVDGRFTLMALSSGAVFADQCESFLAFFKQHCDWMQSDLLPSMAKFGFRPILAPETPAVRNAVLVSLLRAPENPADAQQLVAQLDSADEKTRSRARKVLSDRYDLYRDVIAKKVKDETSSASMRSGLKAIIAAQVDSQLARDTATALDLARDPLYVVSLLGDVDARELPKVVEQLETMTGEKLGPDRAAWKDWATTAAK